MYVCIYLFIYLQFLWFNSAHIQKIYPNDNNNNNNILIIQSFII